MGRIPVSGKVSGRIGATGLGGLSEILNVESADVFELGDPRGSPSDRELQKDCGFDGSDVRAR